MDSDNLKLKAGDHVVYPTHGVGLITAIDEQTIGKATLKMVTVHFEQDKMVLHVPLQKVSSSGMRKLSSRDIMKSALTALKGRARIKRTMWSRRAQEYRGEDQFRRPRLDCRSRARPPCPRRPHRPVLQRAAALRSGARPPVARTRGRRGRQAGPGGKQDREDASGGLSHPPVPDPANARQSAAWVAVRHGDGRIRTSASCLTKASSAR